MPDEDYDDEQDDRPVQLTAKDLRALRKAAKERDDLASQITARDRELAFARAKLDMDDPRVKYFIKGYDGDLDPEKIREQAEADGFLSPTRRVDDEDTKGQQRVARASSGAGETVPPRLEDVIAQASSPEEVMKLMTQAGYPTTWNKSE